MKWGLKMKRQYLLIVLFLILASKALSAPKIKVWLLLYNEHAKILESMAEEQFTAKTGIRVDIEPINWSDVVSKSLLAVAGGDSPDIGYASIDFGLRGALLDLKAEFGDRYDKLAQNWTAGASLGSEYEGRYYGAWHLINCFIQYYRLDLLQKLALTPPQTWDELYKVFPKIQAAGYSVNLAWENMATHSFLPFIWQRGGDILSSNGLESRLNELVVEKAFNEYTDLYRVYKLPQDSEWKTSFNYFFNGESVLLFDGDWTYGNLCSQQSLNGRWSMAKFPGHLVDGKIVRKTPLGGPMIGIYKGSKQKEAAFQFLEWFLDSKTQADFSNQIMFTIDWATYYPANPKAIPLLKGYPQDQLKFLQEALEDSRTTIPHLGSLNRYIDNAIRTRVLLGKDSQELLAKAHKEMQNEIERKRIEYRRYIQPRI